ncbi:MAG: hypothetical protein WC873_01535 [Candidatus Gracilibacteria bacterium]
MSNVTNKITAKRQMLYIKAYVILCLILGMAGGYYFYNNWNEYAFLNNGYAKNLELAVTAKTAETTETENYNSLKPNFDQQNEEIEQELSAIFPIEDKYTEIVRQMDAFEEELATKNNPFEVANVDFQNPVKQAEYSVLPFRMSIRSSAANFTKFLHFIENSGALNDKIRLMDISSIRVNFEKSDTLDLKAKIINFTVQINAYFQ